MQLEILEALHSFAESPPNPGASTIDSGATVSFPPSLLWELLDPTFHHDTQMKFTSPAAILSALDDQGANSQINVTTHFAYPPAHNRDHNLPDADLPVNEQNSTSELLNVAMGMEPISLDDLFPAFQDYGIDWPMDAYAT